jgi:hypothetical protein
MYLIVFLGNPGKEYARTPHNVGFRLADVLFPDASWQKKFHGLYAQEAGTRLLQPQTYMNISGQSVAEAYAFFHLHSQESSSYMTTWSFPSGRQKLQLGGVCKDTTASVHQDGHRHRPVPPHPYRHRATSPWQRRIYVLAPFTPDEEIGLSLLLPRLRPCWSVPKNSHRKSRWNKIHSQTCVLRQTNGILFATGEALLEQT